LSETTNIPNPVTLTGDQITLNSDGIIIDISDNRTVINKKKGKIVLKATNKIVFKPGTKIEPGQSLHASITETNIQEERLLEQIKYELSCLFNESEREKDRFNDDNYEQIGKYNYTNVEAVIDSQQRRISILGSQIDLFASNFISTKHNYHSHIQVKQIHEL
jgi:hypothetical protein